MIGTISRRLKRRDLNVRYRGHDEEFQWWLKPVLEARHEIEEELRLMSGEDEAEQERNNLDDEFSDDEITGLMWLRDQLALYPDHTSLRHCRAAA